MTHLYDLTLIIPETGESISLAGSLEDQEWEALEAFVEYTKELMAVKLVKDGIPTSLKMNFDRNGELTVKTELPPPDDTMVFLHKFRPLGLKREPTYFGKICNILGKAFVDPYLRMILKQSRDIYYGKRMQSGITITSNGVVLNSDEVLHDWLNSYEYHRDKDKREFIDSLHQMLPLDASKVLFLNLLTEKLQAIQGVAGLARVILGQQHTFSIETSYPN